MFITWFSKFVLKIEQKLYFKIKGSFCIRKLIGRTALITGASRGIGKEIAVKLAKVLKHKLVKKISLFPLSFARTFQYLSWGWSEYCHSSEDCNTAQQVVRYDLHGSRGSWEGGRTSAALYRRCSQWRKRPAMRWGSCQEVAHSHNKTAQVVESKTALPVREKQVETLLEICFYLLSSCSENLVHFH